MFKIYFLHVVYFLISITANDIVDITGNYEVVQNIFMQDSNSNPFGYQITGSLHIYSKGQNTYLIKVTGLKLELMSRTASISQGFVEQASNLDSLLNSDFLITLKNGLVTELQLSNDESISMKNLKKAIGSLFQFQVEESSGTEVDSSGLCSVLYKIDRSKIHKSKYNCKYESLVDSINYAVLDGTLTSERYTEIKLSSNYDSVLSITSTESHSLRTNLAEFAVSKIISSLSIKKMSEVSDVGSQYTEDVVHQTLIEIGGNYSKHDLTLENEPKTCSGDSCLKLVDLVKKLEKNINEIGSVKSANSVFKLAQAFRRSNQEEIYQVLKNKDFKNILPILLDIAGSYQNEVIHQAVLKRLRINTEKYKLDLCERYLWALSISPVPSVNITKDVIKLMKQKHQDNKLQQTLILTGTAMVKKLLVLHNADSCKELFSDLLENIKENLDDCKADDESCRQQYLKALCHLENPLATNILLHYAVNSTKKSAVTAMKGLYKLGHEGWTREVKKMAEQFLFSETFDSSGRLIALEIILEAGPTKHMIERIISLLHQSNRELNQMILDKLMLLKSRSKSVANLLNQAEDLRQWEVVAQGGLSTSFTRYFMHKGYLSTDQEITSGILKRGSVNLNIVHENSTNKLFTLGLLSSGLGSFVSSSQESGEEEEETTASIELEVLGVELRPFILFNGQGELMGHVWSGTASSRTPAYQGALVIGIVMLKIPLATAGGIALIRLSSSASLELSGQIEISIWNRNAYSAVYNRAGLSVEGHMSVENNFIKTEMEMQLTAEPSLDLTSNIDFGSSVSLCLMLNQPSSSLRFTTYKVQRITGRSHRLRRSRQLVIPVPGKSYALNKKNTDMCNIIHKYSS